MCHKEYSPTESSLKTGDPVGSLLQKRDQAISKSLAGVNLKMLAEEEPISFTILEHTSVLVDREVS